MAMTQGDIAIGVFQEPAHAHRAIEELRQAGYSDNEIGYLTRVRTTEPDETTGTFIANSAVEGGLVGGLIGAAVALLIPGFGPAVAGGLLAAELGGAALGASARHCYLPWRYIMPHPLVLQLRFTRREFQT